MLSTWMKLVHSKEFIQYILGTMLESMGGVSPFGFSYDTVPADLDKM